MLFFQFVRNSCIERQTKTTQPIKKLFLLIDSWIANYQITKYSSEIRNYLVANPIFREEWRVIFEFYIW